MEVTRTIYCTKCQMETAHAGSVDQNGEFLFYCTAVTEPDPNNPDNQIFHHFVKFPAETTPEVFNELIAEIAQVNAGQVIVEHQLEILNEIGLDE